MNGHLKKRELSGIFILQIVLTLFLSLFTATNALATDEDDIQANLAALVAAYNNKDVSATMSYFSPDFLDSGMTFALQQAELADEFASPDFQPISYVVNSVSVVGDMATVSVTWTGEGTELQVWRKETGVWKFYGDQEFYGIDVWSKHWSEGYKAHIAVEDPGARATAVRVSGPGISGWMDLIFDLNEGRWDDPSDLFISETVPVSPQIYSIEITDISGTTVHNRTITGYVTEFATSLLPSGTVMGPITFSWTGISGAVGYRVELNDGAYARIWDSADLPPSASNVFYDGPPLIPGNTYIYHVVSDVETDGQWNSSFAQGQFTYDVASISLFSGVADSSNLPISGASVEMVGNPAVSTVSSGDGSFVLSGLPASSDFSVKISKTGYLPTYTQTMNSASDITSASFYALNTSLEVASWGVTPGKGVIRGRLSDKNNPTTVNIGGAEVTCSSAIYPGPCQYTIKYDNNGVLESGSATFSNGLFVILDIDDGDTVTVIASKNGWSIPQKSFLVHADAVSRGRILGTPTGSISGTVYYPGALPGMIYVGLFSTPDIIPGVTEPLYLVAVNPTGLYALYTIPEVSNGTYYVGAIKTNDIDSIQMEDPYGMYGIDFFTNFDAAPVIKTSAGQMITDIDFMMVDGTAQNPNPFYVVPPPSGAFPIVATPSGEISMGAAFDGSNYLVGIETNGASHNIVAQMISSSGTPVGSLIDTGRTGIGSAVAFDGTNYLLIWEDDALGTAADFYWTMHGQFISAAGTAVGTPFGISTAGIEFDGIRTLAFGGGKYLATYTRLINPAMGENWDNRYIAGRLIEPNGTMGDEFRISTGYGAKNTVAFDGTNFFVVWVEDSGDTEVRGRFVSSSGALGSEISINASSDPSDNPIAVGFDGTNYMVVWNDETVAGSWDVFGQVVTPAGSPVGNPFAIINAPGSQMPTSIAFDGTRYLVVWADMSNETDWNVYGRYIGTDGTLMGDPFAISTDPGNQMGFVAGYDNGSYFIVLNNNFTMDQDGDFQGGDVYGKFLGVGTGPHSAGGTYTYTSQTGPLVLNWTSSDFICDGPGIEQGTVTVTSLTATSLTWDEGDGYIMTWTRPGGTDGDILGTWTSTDEGIGNTWSITFNSDGTMVLEANIIQCEEGGGGGGDENPKASAQHWSFGYTVPLQYNDSNNPATAVSVTGPGITGSLDLAYDASRGEWNSWVLSETPLLGTTYPEGLPYAYTFTITDTTGTWSTDSPVACFQEQLATDLSPAGTVLGTPEFSWTGIGPGALYAVELNDSIYNRIWSTYDISGTSIVYNGPALTPGETYNYHVMITSSSACSDPKAMSFAQGSFVYAPGSVSGTVSYSGIRTGTIYVALSDTPNITPGVPNFLYVTSMTDPGSYTISNVPNGTYYVGAIRTNDINTIQMADPYGMYGVNFSVDFESDPVVVSNGAAVTDKNFFMIDGTLQNPNPFYVPLPQHTLNLSKAGTGNGSVSSSPAGIDCGATCSSNYDADTIVTLTATPDATSVFAGWSGGCGGTGSCVVTMNTEKNVIAMFTRQTYALTVGKAGTGGGTVNSSDLGISCGATCSSNYDAGSVVTLTATPDATSTFAGWTGACTGTAPCQVTMDAAKNVTATFTRVTYSLSVTRTGGGTVTSTPSGISCGGDCSEVYAAETAVTLTAVPDAGASFAGWSGACTGTGTTCVVSMTSVRNVNAWFVFPMSVSKAGTGNGTVTSSPSGISCGATCSSNYDGGQSVTLTASPDATSVFAGWSGCSTSSGNQCTVTMNSAKSVAATFTRQEYALNVSKAGTGGGAVTSIPTGISCGGDCSEIYTALTSVALAATPDSGSTFAGWSGDADCVDGSVTMDAAKNCTATFMLDVCTAPPSGLVSWWGGDNNALDTAGTNHGTVMNGATYTAGKVGQSFSFDGADDYVDLPPAASQLISNTAGAITAWVYPIAVGDNDIVAAFGSGQNGQGVGLGIYGNVRIYHHTGAYDWQSSTSVSPNRWTFLAYAWDSTTEYIYRDGILSETRPRNFSYVAGAGSIGHGFWGDGANAFPGSIDELAVYNRALTAEEIASIYSSNSAGMCIVKHALTVTKDGSGTGSVASDPAGIDCGLDCSEDYLQDSLITLTATPDATSTFAGWSGACTGTGDCVVTMDSAKSVTATFTIPDFFLTRTDLAFGNVAVGGTSSPLKVPLNNSDVPLSITSITAVGEFSQTNNCGVSVPANTSCEISVSFSPATTGLLSGSIEIISNAAGSPHTISLSGIGDALLDVNFGSGGKVASPMTGGGASGAEALMLQTDGKLVAAGTRNGVFGNEFALQRYNTNGTLDTSFGTDGMVALSPAAGGGSRAQAIVQQSDGKLVVAGTSHIGAGTHEFVLVRFDTNGSLDATFGTGGKVVLPINPGSTTTANMPIQSLGRSHALVQQADGKLVALGYNSIGDEYAFTLARYLSDGTLDTDFGSNGIVNTLIGPSYYMERPALVVQPDGKLVAAGIKGGLYYSVPLLVRYNPDGTLDESFGVGGRTIDVAGEQGIFIYAMALQGDGKLVTAGTGSSYGSGFMLTRYNADGTRDSGFGTGGTVMTPIDVTVDFAFALQVQPDGKLVAAGTSVGAGGSWWRNGSIVRYNSNGSLDTTFGSGGKLLTTVGVSAAGNQDSKFYALILQPDGKLVAAGDSIYYGYGSDFSLVRYATSGASTPSLTPYVADANTVLLDHFDGSSNASILAYRETGASCGPSKASATPNFSYDQGQDGLSQALTLNPPTGEPAGSSTYITYPGGELLSQANGTIEFWTYLTSYGTGLSFVSQGPYPGACSGWTFGMGVSPTGQLSADAWAAFNMNSGEAIVPLNTWTHVAATWGSAGAKLYINGVVVGNDANTGMPASGYGGSVMVNYFAGNTTRLDELRISNIQRVSFELHPSYQLAVTKQGTGSGTVTSSPTGINCGATCSSNYNSGMVVTLTATPDTGSSFAGWSGDEDCIDGMVTMDTAKTCTATFEIISYTLSIVKAGTGAGTVTTSPAGISCGGDCSEIYVSGTTVALTATPDSGSTFAGWVGDEDCSDGTVTMDADKYCGAVFNSEAATDAPWARTYESIGYEEAYSVKQATDGGYIVAGVDGTLNNTLVLKINRLGDIEWQRTIQSLQMAKNSDALQQTADGGYGIAGSSLKCDEGPVCQQYGYIVKLAPNGDLLWQRGYKDDVGYGSFFAAIQQTADGGFIATGKGSILGMVQPYGKLWIVKIDSLGNIQWQRHYGDLSAEGIGDSAGKSVRQTADGGFIVAGEVSYVRETTTWVDAWLIKLANNGTLEWHKVYVGSGDDRFTSVLQTADSGYLVAGSTSLENGLAGWVLKADQTGAIEWQKAYKGDNNVRFDQIAAADGGFVLDVSDQVVLKIDGSGEIVWTRDYRNAGSIMSVQMTSGGFIMAGISSEQDFLVQRTDANGVVPGCYPIEDASLTMYVTASSSESSSLTIHVLQIKTANVGLAAGAAGLASFDYCSNYESLSVTKTGEGTLSSFPSGIDCGEDCSEIYLKNTQVVLGAAPGTGYLFSGWSGDEDCIDGMVTMDTAKTCTATFEIISYTLSIGKAGNGLGNVISSPAGIDCGVTCSSNYDFGIVISLSATPDVGSVFSGWSGDADCEDGQVTMLSGINCTATFTTVPQHTLTVSKLGSGSGSVTSSPAGIDCGSTCSAPFNANELVTLTAAADTGSIFVGWSGACAGAGVCQVTMNSAKNVNAHFVAAETVTWTNVGGIQETCVMTASALATALFEAGADYYPNTIKVVQGTYIGLFAFSNTDDEDMELLGGYTAGCATRSNNPALTVLNGDLDADTYGNGVVLDLIDQSEAGTGNITVDGFHVTNGYNGVDDGGGIRVFTDSGDITIINNIVSGSAAYNGGGIGAETNSGTISIISNNVHNNSATETGGGIAASTDSGSITIINNIVHGNGAIDAGGIGVETVSGSVNVINNIAYGNIAQGLRAEGTTFNAGGGIGLISDSGVVTVLNNTISGNTGFLGGGLAIGLGDAGYADIQNNILWGNTGDIIDVAINTDHDLNYTHGTFWFDYNNTVMNQVWANSPDAATTPASFFGIHNINGIDPKFVDPAGGNYHLLYTSPVINKGTSHTSLPSVDIDGESRAQGTAVDMGADEYVPVAVTVSTSKPSPQPLSIVGTVKFTATATGGNGNYLYQFRLKVPGGSWTVVQDYSSTNFYNVTPTQAGAYEVFVYAKNTGSPAAYEATAYTSFVVSPAAQSVTVVTDKASPQQLATAGTIKFTAAASGGSGSYVYQFRMRAPGGSYTVVRDYNSSNIYNWTPSQWGTYDLIIYAKNAGSPAAYEAVRALSFTIKSQVTGLQVTTDKTSPKTLATVGTVKFTAAASGGSGSYVYQFRIKAPGGSWTVAQGYNSNNIYNWTPTQMGTYEFFIYAKNNGSTASYEGYKYMTFTVTNPVTGLQVTTDKTSPKTLATVGTVKFTAAASGGTGTYVYQFKIKAPGGSWTVAQGYNSNNIYNWTPIVGGTYEFFIYAKNSGSAASYEGYQYMTFAVSP